VRAAPEGLYVASDEVRARLEEDFELRALPCRPGASARELEARARDGSVAGRVGLISSRSRPFCAGCGRLRLTSRGTLIGCLARGDGPDLRPLLRGGADDEALAKVVGAVLAAKAPRSGWPTKLPMGGVGG
jgi:cyclic pyranopterin phosphate synthase